MPDHLATDALGDGLLVALEIEDDTEPTEGLTIYATHRRDRALGPTARLLLDTVRTRMRK